MSIKRIILFFLLVLVIGSYIVGWKTVQFNNSDPIIGEKIVFTEPMLYLENFGPHMAGEYISKRYRYYMLPEKSWKLSSRQFENVVVSKVKNKEEFIVTHVFTLQPRGFLTGAFSEKVDFLLLEGQHKKNVVIGKIYYEYN